MSEIVPDWTVLQRWPEFTRFSRLEKRTRKEGSVRQTRQINICPTPAQSDFRVGNIKSSSCPADEPPYVGHAKKGNPNPLNHHLVPVK
jgi:hypothetical protein